MCVLFLEVVIGKHRSTQLQLPTGLQLKLNFSITGQEIDLGYCATEGFALEMSKDFSVIFDIAPKYCISHSFLWTVMDTPFLI